MTHMQISAAESGTLRVIHIDLPSQAVERFTTQAGTGEWPLQYALGAKSLRASFVEVVAIRDLGEMALSAYLTEGYGLTSTEFKAARPQINALKGHVLLLPSQAFGGVEQTLTISSPLRWIGTFSEDTRPASLNQLRSDGARGSLSGGPSGPSPRDGNTLRGVLIAAVCVLLLVLGLFVLRSMR